jgi:hypothetical protein
MADTADTNTPKGGWPKWQKVATGLAGLAGAMVVGDLSNALSYGEQAGTRQSRIHAA